MPSFDIVSKINLQEVDNAVNSVLRELTNRYDFKGAVFSLELKQKENLISLSADSEYKLDAIRDSLKVFATKRGVDVKSFDFQKEEKAGGNMLKQDVKLRNGIEQEIAKKIVKQIKDSKAKVQASIRGDEVRIDGKKRDDLQQIIALLRSGNYEIPLQFINFRD
ncbi:MAG: YajQ family cyclic di-GMP-binding protein [Alphaproteobacteria bacterium RIFCSPLOWO2_01_FULL_40_26]|nr:MAG: YajQ family cyclic di-GMP-binding protein [Alphaproteobacteria bacterium RIFCSPHIGHO2_02_FULL_40_34]OFW94815.1 MAG: YajQ family cyclic di-GMP-binding protein [Alphaproteobacteria bacterium RIFCSPLOWO2_01_FULL_40_26]OFX10441.1 MAG: YajQ family cyclic di-GMP-binding protein [Alphaproteobacteria bacterium RIFCSPLOWO2_02_FULL_40_19]OFX11015.1 MAG: YajQ family cyclic di-GMP-binding protein [Alphaproteobacteria bacterium RIFCSPLOWO2_12_FULL_40_11]